MKGNRTWKQKKTLICPARQVMFWSLQINPARQVMFWSLQINPARQVMFWSLQINPPLFNRVLGQVEVRGGGGGGQVKV